MYLSRIRLDVSKRETQIALVSPNKIHGAIESSFFSKQERNLWRIDTLGDSRYLLLLSKEKPDLQHVKKQFGFINDADEIKEYDALLNRIQKNSVWQFRLVANPTHAIMNNGDKRGKVVAHVSEQYQMEWLYNKAKQNGFVVLNEGSCVVGSEWKSFYHAQAQPLHNQNNRRVRLKQATYQGILRVEDEEEFRNALINGIGRGKAYGMGLLTVMAL